MSVRLYEKFKVKHDSVKPIRGRTPECRPIGRRDRIHETIREVIIEGVPGVACRLHNTDCVTYLRDGSILLYTGGWNTTTTAAFIHKHYPTSCGKQHNKLWVRSGEHVIPLPSHAADKPLKLEPVESATGMELYRVVFDTPPMKRVVDKVKAKAARAPIMPFLAWVKTFLALSDGLVSEQFRREVCGEIDRIGWDGQKQVNYSWFVTDTPYNFLRDLKESDYPRALCALTRGHVIHSKDPVVFDILKAQVYTIVEAHADIHKSVEVMIGSKTIRSLV
jgi:hypothetical protein